MNDRELLELAAKAAGYRHEVTPIDPQPHRPAYWAGWNPLTDDGDAFRLAAGLGMVVDFSRPSAALPFTRHRYDLSEGGGNDAAARRAIVRAAAEIGRNMK